MSLSPSSYCGLILLRPEYEYWTIEDRIIKLSLHEFNVACYSGLYDINTRISSL